MFGGGGQFRPCGSFALLLVSGLLSFLTLGSLGRVCRLTGLGGLLSVLSF